MNGLPAVPAPPDGARTIDVVDMHTAGEPVRIVVGGYPRLEGRTLLDKRRQAAARHDDLRTALMHEPRGHAGMYGVIPCAPSLPGADLACLFTHASGYSTMCGHATIAFGRYARDAGLVTPQDGSARFGLELPCGLVAVEAMADGACAFDSVPAFVEARDVALDLGGETIVCDVAFGGAYYAILPASRLGVGFGDGLPALIAAGRRVFAAASAAIRPRHPTEPDLSFLYGVILTDDAAPDADTANLCLFGEGQIDRSPTGSGVTARLALDALSGRVAYGAPRRFRGPTGQGFVGTARRAPAFHGRPAIVARVEGRAFYSATSRFIVERDDSLGRGFLLFASETST